jgi:hypothetical protein
LRKPGQVTIFFACGNCCCVAAGIEAVNLGEAVAFGVLQNYSTTYDEDFQSFSVTKFDGTTITI